METDGTLNEKQELILNLSDDSYSLQKRAESPRFQPWENFKM